MKGIAIDELTIAHAGGRKHGTAKEQDLRQDDTQDAIAKASTAARLVVGSSHDDAELLWYGNDALFYLSTFLDCEIVFVCEPSNAIGINRPNSLGKPTSFLLIFS